MSGGDTGAVTTATMEVLDLKSPSLEWKKCASMNETMIAYNDELLVFGGYNGSNRVASCEK